VTILKALNGALEKGVIIQGYGKISTGLILTHTNTKDLDLYPKPFLAVWPFKIIKFLHASVSPFLKGVW
jgi:hypothetical protein